MSVNEPLQPNYNFAWVKADNTRLTKEELHNQRRQDMNEKPEALRLAEWIESDPIPGDDKIASTLRRLHAENERLTANRDELDWMVQRLAVSEALLEAKNKRLREALESIAANACCDKCQEAALVAKAALRREDV